MAKNNVKEFTKGQMVKFYVKRFRRWYEGKVEGKETLDDGLKAYNVRVTKSEGPLAKYEIGNLWLVEDKLMEAL